MEPRGSYDHPEFDWEAAKTEIDKARTALSGLLSPTPTSRDEIIRQSGYSTAIVTAALLEMELNGEAIVEPDGRVALGINF